MLGTKYLIAGGFVISWFCNIYSAGELCKIFHHKTNVTQATLHNSLELGKLVLYFSSKPLINTLSDRITNKGKRRTIVFFFPQATVSKECTTMMDNVNTFKSNLYTIHIQTVNKPITGVQLTFIYDPEHVSFTQQNDLEGIEYAEFEAITTQKGLVFTFYNKQYLQSIKQKSEPILRTASHRPHIVIDCGHGGHDTGAVGYFDVQEKQLTRMVGDKVADTLKKKGFKVSFTRVGDEFVELDQRTTFSNTIQADLFISIHANFSPNKNAHGIETFCLDNSLFSIVGNKKESSDNTPFFYSTCAESNLLAHTIHTHTLSSARTYEKNIPDRKVKHSVSQVLLGTTMPSALIEIGFVSHEQEAALLINDTYQNLLAQGICSGIEAYYKKSS